jgi:hypothetical protein
MKTKLLLAAAIIASTVTTAHAADYPPVPPPDLWTKVEIPRLLEEGTDPWWFSRPRRGLQWTCVSDIKTGVCSRFLLFLTLYDCDRREQVQQMMLFTRTDETKWIYGPPHSRPINPYLDARAAAFHAAFVSLACD